MHPLPTRTVLRWLSPLLHVVTQLLSDDHHENGFTPVNLKTITLSAHGSPWPELCVTTLGVFVVPTTDSLVFDSVGAIVGLGVGVLVGVDMSLSLPASESTTRLRLSPQSYS